MSYLSYFDDLEASTVRGPQGALFVPGLSVEQLTALNAPFSDGAVIIAGAGAGKTKLLVERVAALLKTGVSPDRIAVVAFTRKSAAEIVSRVKVKLGIKTGLPVCSTIDSLAYATLTKSGKTIVLATPEQEAECLQQVRSLLPEDMEDLSDKELLLLVNRAREEFDSRTTAGLLGLAYAEILETQGLSDFTTLLTQACTVLRDRFDHVIVDESQDLSQLQLKFLQTVAVHAVFWFIGDPDQAIYAFRGAHSNMMEHLRSLVPHQYLLTTNYRSAKLIVLHANNVIQSNPRPFSVAWQAARPEVGSVTVSSFSNSTRELEENIEWLTASPHTRCVLARTQALVAAYKALGLPGYTVHEAKGLEWAEVRVLGCEEGLFPHPLSGVQEERRLFYVAMTRARDTLALTYCESRSASRKTQRKPSRFLFETQALGGSVSSATTDASIVAKTSG
jgi:superfamily I DNA/RNA helicase